MINPFGQGAQSTSSTYAVREGETLHSIAAAAWGDASLWYLIAEANGLGAGSQLVAGQNLILPDRVTNARNGADTFKVYDPNAALGDLSPTSAKPPKKPGALSRRHRSEEGGSAGRRGQRGAGFRRNESAFARLEKIAERKGAHPGKRQTQPS